jgi:gliding motility-associated-like protein
MFLVFISTDRGLKKTGNRTYISKICCKGLYILGILSFFVVRMTYAQTPGIPGECTPIIRPSPNLPVVFVLDVSGSKIMDAAALATLGSVDPCDGSPITSLYSDPKILTCADLTRPTIRLIASNLRPNPLAVSFTVPTDAVTDAAGNIYVADSYNYSVRKIATDGEVTTFAGGPPPGYADDKGTAAKFKAIYGITIDAQGNLYVIDANNRVRKIAPDGTTTTLAGSGASKTEDGTGTAASFLDPRGITIDASGNLYITQNDFMIRKVTPAGVVTTITPPQSVSKLNTLTGITVDALGNLYVTDYSGNYSAIKKIAPDGTITTIAGGNGLGSADGTGSAASFNQPSGIIMDAQGNLYVTDSGNNTIRKITPAGVVTTLPLTNAGTNTKAILKNPIGIKIDPSGNLIVVDAVNGRLISVTPTGQVSLIAGNGDVGSRNGNIHTPAMLGGESFADIPVTIVSSTGTSSQPGIKPTLISYPLNATVCAGGEVKFNAIPNANVTNYQWQVNGINAGNNSPEFISTNLQEGDKVTCTVANNINCTVPQTSDPITAHIIPPPQITFNGNPTIELGSSITLNPDIHGDIQAVRWSPADGLNSITLKNPVAYPAVTTTYYLTVTSSTFCETTVGVTVTVTTPIHIPNTFSPNGDGINDLWLIKDLANYPGCTVDIFNRYGQKLFHSRGYGKPWDGILNGRKLPPGTYYYTITPQDGAKPLSGWVTIII